MLRTRLCELLGIEVPVLGAPMGPEISGLELAAAVSNAGGVGMISFGGYPPQALKERIRKLRSLTSRPFGFNILLQGPQLPVAEALFVEACIEERVPVMSFFWGDPTPYVEKSAQGRYHRLRPSGFGEWGKASQECWRRFHHSAGS